MAQVDDSEKLDVEEWDAIIIRLVFEPELKLVAHSTLDDHVALSIAEGVIGSGEMKSIEFVDSSFLEIYDWCKGL